MADLQQVLLHQILAQVVEMQQPLHHYIFSQIFMCPPPLTHCPSTFTMDRTRANWNIDVVQPLYQIIKRGNSSKRRFGASKALAAAASGSRRARSHARENIVAPVPDCIFFWWDENWSEHVKMHANLGAWARGGEGALTPSCHLKPLRRRAPQGHDQTREIYLFESFSTCGSRKSAMWQVATNSRQKCR